MSRVEEVCEELEDAGDLHRLQQAIVRTDDSVDLAYVQNELCGSNSDEECEVDTMAGSVWRSAFAVIKPNQAALDACDSDEGCKMSPFVEALLDGVTFSDLAAASADDLPAAVRQRGIGKVKSRTAAKRKQQQEAAARIVEEEEELAVEVKTEEVLDLIDLAESEPQRTATEGSPFPSPSAIKSAAAEEDGACVSDEPAAVASAAGGSEEAALASTAAATAEEQLEAAIAAVTAVAERAKARLQSGKDNTAKEALLEAMVEHQELLQVLEADVRFSIPVATLVFMGRVLTVRVTLWRTGGGGARSCGGGAAKAGAADPGGAYKHFGDAYSAA